MSPTAHRAELPPPPAAVTSLAAPQTGMPVVGVEVGVKMGARVAVGLGVCSGGEAGGEGAPKFGARARVRLYPCRGTPHTPTYRSTGPHAYG